MSAAAQEALTKPVGLDGSAAVAASYGYARRRIGRRGGVGVVCACCQWSSGHPRQGTLVRHFMGGGLVASMVRVVGAITLSGSQRSALTPALGSRGVPGSHVIKNIRGVGYRIAE